MRKIQMALMVLIWSSCLTAGATEALSLSFEGFDKISFGAKLSALEIALGEKVASPKDEDEKACHYVSFKKYPGVLFMIEKGIVTRAEGDQKTFLANPFGIKNGDSVKEVKRLHPEAKSKKNIYDENSPDLNFDSKDGKSRFGFNSRKVKSGRFAVVATHLSTMLKAARKAFVFSSSAESMFAATDRRRSSI